MKKNLLLLILLGFYSISQAQQLKWNIQAGTDLTNIAGCENYKARFGYRVGIGAELAFDKTWSVNASLFFLNKRVSYAKELVGTFIMEEREYIMGCSATEKMNTLYLQLPIKAAARLVINKNSALKISAGPYIAYGIGGKTKTGASLGIMEKPQVGNDLSVSPSHKSSQSFIKKEVEAFSKESGLNRFECGLALGVDFEYKRWFIGVGGEYGLTPISGKVYESPVEALYGVNTKEIYPRYKTFEMHIGMSF